MSIANLTFDHNLGQYVAEVTVGKRRIASLMGQREPTQAERVEVANRLHRLAHTHTRRSNYVPAGTADDAAYRGIHG
jgi:hypothetical protein